MKLPDPKDILQNWLTQMSDQTNASLENLKRDIDPAYDTPEDDLEDVDQLDVESVEYVHVDQEYYQEELYNGMMSGNMNSFFSFNYGTQPYFKKSSTVCKRKLN